MKDGSVLEGLLRAYSLDGNIMVDAVDHICLIDERECRREELGITELVVRRALDAFWRMEYGE